MNENTALKEQCKSILSQHLLLVDDKSELQEQLNILEKDRSELQGEFEQACQLFDKDMKHYELKDEIKAMIESCEEMTTQLIKREQEINALESDLQNIETKYQQLIMKSENDERQYQSEIKTSGDLANQIQEQHNAVLVQEKLKLEACTTQIRDLIRNKDKSTQDINKIVQENIGLKASLKAVIEENTGLKEQTEQSKQDMNDLKAASTEAAAAVMDKNDRLEQRVYHIKKNKNQLQDLQQENKRLLNLVESMNKPIEKDQDDIMRTHTKAQLVLIEYLEGQDDVIQAMAKFKKQLETE